MDSEFERLLRQGLGRTPPPQPNPGFEHRVMARLRSGRENRWRLWLRIYWICAALFAAGIFVYVGGFALPEDARPLAVPVSFAATAVADRWLRRSGAWQ